ncbi:MAG: hypothetical protein ACKO4W_08400, partial [Bacteroidota bacterium]
FHVFHNVCAENNYHLLACTASNGDVVGTGSPENKQRIDQKRDNTDHKLLDGFEGKLQSSKWAKITKTSADTALRDIRDLVEKGMLAPGKPGGRSTDYTLVVQPIL